LRTTLREETLGLTGRFALPLTEASVQRVGFSGVITIFQVFSAAFTRSLTCKGLVSRWLRQNGGLFEFNIEDTELKMLRFHELSKGWAQNLKLANVRRL
jgi:hypothetical protein